jgi:DNA-binding NtrC family response regulator
MNETSPAIIIVSDDESQRLINRNYVRNALDALKVKATIHVALDGEKAQQKIEADPNPSRFIVVTDYLLPGVMNGVQLYRNLPQSLRKRTVIMTGARDLVEADLASMGLDKPRIIGSPVNADQLREVLSAYL